MQQNCSHAVFANAGDVQEGHPKNCKIPSLRNVHAITHRVMYLCYLSVGMVV